VLRIAGSQDVMRSSGTGLSGCFSFLASFQAAKLVKAHASCALIRVGRDTTLGKNSKFVVANKNGEAFAGKGGAGVCAAGAWRVVVVD